MTQTLRITNMKQYDINHDMRYLQLLAQSFPSIAEASTEIINLQAILNLPKGTEHFLADIHGEYEAFLHVLKNASGNIKRKVNELFGNTLREQDKRELCTLIYYPEQKLEQISTTGIISPFTSWWRFAVMCQASTPVPRCANHCHAISPISYRSFCTSIRKITTRLHT